MGKEKKVRKATGMTGKSEGPTGTWGNEASCRPDFFLYSIVVWQRCGGVATSDVAPV